MHSHRNTHSTPQHWLDTATLALGGLHVVDGLVSLLAELQRLRGVGRIRCRDVRSSWATTPRELNTLDPRLRRPAERFDVPFRPSRPSRRGIVQRAAW